MNYRDFLMWWDYYLPKFQMKFCLNFWLIFWHTYFLKNGKISAEIFTTYFFHWLIFLFDFYVGANYGGSETRFELLKIYGNYGNRCTLWVCRNKNMHRCKLWNLRNTGVNRVKYFPLQRIKFRIRRGQFSRLDCVHIRLGI